MKYFTYTYLSIPNLIKMEQKIIAYIKSYKINYHIKIEDANDMRNIHDLFIHNNTDILNTTSSRECDESNIVTFYCGLYCYVHNDKRTEDYFTKLIAKDYVIAIYYLGLWYQKQQDDRFIACFEKASERGFFLATHKLGQYHQECHDYDKAEKYYLKNINKGHDSSIYSLASLYWLMGENEKMEYYYKLGAKRGCLHSNYRLGVMYEASDPKRAKQYFITAAEKGHINAKYRLGVMYYKKRKEVPMKRYFTLAIKSGDVKSMYHMGLWYHDNQKYNAAKYYYTMAMNRGSIDAAYDLGRLFEELKNYDEMIKCYQIAVDKRHPYAMYNLGMWYRKNDVDKMEKYLVMAANHGHLNSMAELGYYFQVHADNDKMIKYYVHGANLGSNKCINKINRIVSIYHNVGLMCHAYDYLNDDNKKLFAKLIENSNSSPIESMNSTCTNCFANSVKKSINRYPFCGECYEKFTTHSFLPLGSKVPLS